MIIDTSALVVLLIREPEQIRMSAAIAAAGVRMISAPTLLETSMVVEGKAGEEGVRDLDKLVADLRLDIVPFTNELVEFGRDAFRRYGKGRHPARLNMGDCFSYALAKATGEPLLFKGEDFSKTDIATAVY